MPIVEHLTNSVVEHGLNNGEKLMTTRSVRRAFKIIHLLTGRGRPAGPGAITNSGSREDSTRTG